MLSLKDRLQHILIDDQIISEKDLDRALKEQKECGGQLSKILVKMRLVSEDDLTHALSKGLGMPPIDISRLKIDPDVIKIISKEVAQKNQILPVSKIGDNLTLAMADPLKCLTSYRLSDLARFFSSSSASFSKPDVHQSSKTKCFFL